MRKILPGQGGSTCIVHTSAPESLRQAPFMVQQTVPTSAQLPPSPPPLSLCPSTAGTTTATAAATTLPPFPGRITGFF